MPVSTLIETWTTGCGTDCVSITGGLIVLGLFARQWTVDESVTQFTSLTRSFFGTKRPRSFVRSVHKCLKSLVSDGIYDAAKLEQSLQQAFSAERILFSYPSEGVSRAKIGVIATTTEDATPVVLSNYNGVRPCKSSSGMQWLTHELLDPLLTSPQVILTRVLATPRTK